MMDLRLRREKAAYQFELQAPRLGYRIEKRVSSYKFRLCDLDDVYKHQMTAIILPDSFDFYTYRLLKSRTFDILVVQHHNAVVPVNVIDLDTSIKYYPGDKVSQAMRENARRRNSEEKKLLLSQILLGTNDGKEALAKMQLRNRQKYLKEADSYLQGRVGRPFSS